MKAVILAAGKGTRMMPLTKDMPKVLIPINNKPFLTYLLKNLKLSGFNDIAIITGYLKEKIEKFIEENNISATLIEQKEQLGTGHALIQAKEFCKENDFILINGDSLFSIKDLKNIKVKENDSYCYIVGKDVKEPSKYGVLIKENNNQLKEIKEKPKDFFGNTVNVGLYKFTKNIWNSLENIKESKRGEYELTDAITNLAKENKVKVIELNDFWIDLGEIKDIPKVEKTITKENIDKK